VVPAGSCSSRTSRSCGLRETARPEGRPAKGPKPLSAEWAAGQPPGGPLSEHGKPLGLRAEAVSGASGSDAAVEIDRLVASWASREAQRDCLRSRLRGHRMITEDILDRWRKMMW